MVDTESESNNDDLTLQLPETSEQTENHQSNTSENPTSEAEKPANTVKEKVEELTVHSNGNVTISGFDKLDDRTKQQFQDILEKAGISLGDDGLENDLTLSSKGIEKLQDYLKNKNKEQTPEKLQENGNRITFKRGQDGKYTVNVSELDEKHKKMFDKLRGSLDSLAINNGDGILTFDADTFKQLRKKINENNKQVEARKKGREPEKTKQQQGSTLTSEEKEIKKEKKKDKESKTWGQ